MKLTTNCLIIAVLFFFSSCDAVTSALSSGIDITKAENIPKLKEMLGKHVKSDAKINSISFSFANSSSFTNSSYEASVIYGDPADKSKRQFVNIDLKSGDTTSTELTRKVYTRPIPKEVDYLASGINFSDIDFNAVPGYINTAAGMIPTEYKYGGMGNYSIEKDKSSAKPKHSFMLMVTKKGAGTRIQGRTTVTEYFELHFNVDESGKMSMRED